MVDNSRVRNLAVLFVLVAIFTVPSLFLSNSTILDIVSFLMLVFGVSGLYLIAEEVWGSFWSGMRDRASLALYGLFALFLSVVVMRTYGILTRNSEAANALLSPTYTYAAMVYLQFVGLFLFSRASTPPTVVNKRAPRWGQLIVGILIGALVASSRILEPVLASVGKVFTRFF